MAKATATPALSTNEQLLLAALRVQRKPARATRLVDVAVDVINGVTLGTTEVLHRSTTGVGATWSALDELQPLEEARIRGRLIEQAASRNGVSMAFIAALTAEEATAE